MTEIKKAKKTDYRTLHKGTHHQIKKDKNTRLYNWNYDVRNDRTLSKITIQEFEIIDKERKDKGTPIKFEDIYCVLSHHQAREFVRNLKK